MAWALTHIRTVLFVGISIVFVSLLGAIQYLQKDGELARSQLKTEQERTANYRAVNTAQQMAIDTLAASIETNNRITKQVSERIDDLRQSQETTSAALEELGRTNVQVRDYLNLPVPDDVRRLLGDKLPGPVRTPATPRP